MKLAGSAAPVELGQIMGQKVLGMLDDPSSIAASYHKGGWNDLVIIAKGNHLRHWVNGVQTIDFTDEGPQQQLKSGVLALQIHAGGPMVTEFKDIRLKKYAQPEK